MDVDVGTPQHRTDIGHDGVARQVEAVELHRHAAGVLAGTGRLGAVGRRAKRAGQMHRDARCAAATVPA